MGHPSEYDAETGLYFYRARYYDSSTGRFLNEDPINFEGGINFYQFVENSPPNLTDPYGLKVYVCCRRLLGDRWWKRPFARATFQRHCYILITPDITDPSAERVRYSLNRPVGKKTGEIRRNVPSDRVGNEKRGCKEATPTPGCKTQSDYNEGDLRSRLEELVELQEQGKVNESTCRSCGLNYRRLGPNSNTFVSDMLKQHGFIPPPMSRAPGYNRP